MNDDGSVIWALVAFLIPIVGIILWAAWHEERPKCARMAAWGTIVSLIVGAIGLFALLSWMGPLHIHLSH